MRLAAVLLLFSNAVFAQYSGPAVDTCLAYAKREAARDGTQAKNIVFERDQNLMIERYTRTGPEHLMYEVAIEDAKVFTRPWRMSMPLYRRQEAKTQILENECYALAREDAQ